MMNLNYIKLVLRSSSSLIKAHCCELCNGLPGTFPRFFILSHSRSFSWRKKNPQDSRDDFELFEDTIESNYKDANVEEITGGDPQKAKMFKVCQVEIDLLVKKGGRIPKTMTSKHWCELIKLRNHRLRARYVRLLWLHEVRSNNFKLKKIENHQKYLEAKAIRGENDRSEIPTNAPVKYGLCDTSLVHRLREAQINKFYNYKLLQAMMFGPHILVDCGYEAFMSHKEMNHCIQQLLTMWFDNRDHKNPFDVIFCNLEETNPIFQKLQRTLVGLDTDPTFPFNHTEKHYLDLFPQKNLVYLTPHCNTYLKKFNSNDIYIIGAMVKQTHCEPISMAKAKKDQIRYAKLPLDVYLNWKKGTKSLSVNQCLAIMNDVKDGKDWPYAFRHVPENELYINTIDEEAIKLKVTRHNVESMKKQFRRN